MVIKHRYMRLLAIKSCIMLLVACQGENGEDSVGSNEGSDKTGVISNDICQGVDEQFSSCGIYSEQLLTTINNHKYHTQEYKKVNASPYQSEVAPDKYIEVYVNKESAVDFSAIDPDVTLSGIEVNAGTTIIREVWTPSENALSQFTAMVKMEPGYFPEGGDFAYAVIDLQGNVLRGGKLEDCAVCHESREFDGFLFGVPELEKTGLSETPTSPQSLEEKYTEMAQDIIRSQTYLDETLFQRINTEPYPSVLNTANNLDVFVSNIGAINFQSVDPANSDGPGVQLAEETVIVRQVIDSTTQRTKTYTIMIKGPEGYYPEGGDFYYGVFDFLGNLQFENGKALEGKLSECGTCHFASRRNTGFIFGVPEVYR